MDFQNEFNFLFCKLNVLNINILKLLKDAIFKIIYFKINRMYQINSTIKNIYKWKYYNFQAKMIMIKINRFEKYTDEMKAKGCKDEDIL